MRNRILAALGVAALASVGIATPATALSSSTADVYVVHAVPGLTVDVYVNGNLVTDPAAGFLPGAFASFIDLPTGPATLDVVAKTGVAPATITPGSGTLTDDVVLAANTSYTVVAGLTTAGDPTLFPPFVNNLTALPSGQSGVTVRHTANAPEVRAVVVDGSDVVNIFGDGATLTNGQAARTTVPAGTYNVQVRVAEGDAVAIDVPGLVLAPNTHYFIHAFGPNSAEPTFRAIAFPIAGAVAGVPAGSAGLVAEDGMNGGLLVGGAAALLALLAAAGVVVARRQGASVER